MLNYNIMKTNNKYASIALVAVGAFGKLILIVIFYYATK